MKIKKLRLKGFLGIQKGLGLEEIEIDFTGATGLSAFDGPNGVGKSSVLENLSAYNQLASRDGSLFRHCYTRNAEKEFSFSYDGHEYKTLLKIDAQAERQEGFVWRDGVPMINGKISEYAKYIKNLLGSPELFYNSVFCSQNSTKLSDLTTGQLKGLFAEFLRLDRYQAYEDTAKQAGNVLTGTAGQLESRIESLRNIIYGEEYAEAIKLQHPLIVEGIGIVPLFDEIKAEITGHRQKEKELFTSKEFLILEQAQKRNAIDSLKETISKNALAWERKNDLQAQIDRLEAELAKEKAQAETERDALATKWKEIQAAIHPLDILLLKRADIEKAAEKVTELTAKIETTTAEIDRLTGEISTKKDALAALERERNDIATDIKAYDHDEELAAISAKLAELKTEQAEKQRQLAEIENDRELAGLKADLKRLQEKAYDNQRKDPDCKSTICAFIVSALAAQKEIPPIETRVAERETHLQEAIAYLRESFDPLANQIIEAVGLEVNRVAEIGVHKEVRKNEIAGKEAAIKAFHATIKEAEKKASDGKEEIKQLRCARDLQKALADKLPEIQVAAGRKADLEKQLAENVERGQEKKATWWEARENALKMWQSGRDKLDAIAIDFQAEIKLQGIQGEIKEIETNRLPALEKEIQAAREKIATLQAELARIEEAEKELEQVRAEKETVTRDVSEWKYLQNACGKNGLQALEIDGAAPLITGYANQLLSQAFGPLFSVKLLTQDEEGRECLDIVVITENGEEVLLENLSGGQKIWCLMALRLAMTLLSKEKSGHNFESFYADELDGPLDPDNAVNFVNMYRGFMEVGKFSNGFFISHREACRSLADNVLHFEYGKTPYWG